MQDRTGNSLEIGETIRRMRRARRLTQAELAGDAFSKSYISQLERGNVTPSVRALELIAAKLGVSASWLLARTSSTASALLRAASVALFLGDTAHASQLLKKIEKRSRSLQPPILWETLLLKIRLRATEKEWPSVLQASRELQQVINEGPVPPGRISIPHNYWWGHAWLALGNRHQAVRRWENGLKSIQIWGIEAEALRLMAGLAKLYKALGDDQASRSVSTRLRAAIAHLRSASDLSRWVMARFTEQSLQADHDDHYIDEALWEAEIWMRAERTLSAANELRRALEEQGPDGLKE